jgi:aminoglycoside phosphotransferase (APT) family kinase protein
LLDLDWERSIPIINVTIDEIADIVAEYDSSLTVTDYNAIQIGCRNSNFVVSANKGKLLLRIADASEFNNERIAYELVKDRVNVPRILYHTTKHNLNIFIYQYIDGVSFQKFIIESGQCDYSLLEQAAEAAAIIHNTSMEKTIGLAEYDVPPFEAWYQYFLDNPAVRARIGEDIHERLQRLVLDKQEMMAEIDSYKSFIHCDFRPANMIVDEQKKVFIVDWESACTGHSLADVGQFFRYRSFFTDTHISLFEQAYNAAANRKLPGNWSELSLFRDLVNPLQMLSSNHEAHYKNLDLLRIIEKSLSYWGY